MFRRIYLGLGRPVISNDKRRRKTFWAYGGDWMDASSNADAFCANGVLFADHTPSAKAVQMRYDHQQVNFYLENEDAKVTDGTIKVKVVNELENSTLENYNIIWSLKKMIKRSQQKRFL